MQFVKFKKTGNFKNSKDLQCGEFQNFSIFKIPDIPISKNIKFFKLFNFEKQINFKNTTICKTLIISWIYNFINCIFEYSKYLNKYQDKK